MFKVRKRVPAKEGEPERYPVTARDRTAFLAMAVLGLVFISLTPTLINRLIEGVPLETLLSEASPFILLTWTVGLLALIGFFAVLVTMGFIDIRNSMDDKKRQNHASD